MNENKRKCSGSSSIAKSPSSTSAFYYEGIIKWKGATTDGTSTQNRKREQSPIESLYDQKVSVRDTTRNTSPAEVRFFSMAAFGGTDVPAEVVRNGNRPTTKRIALNRMIEFFFFNLLLGLRTIYI